jgi:hypothetical protein
MARARIRFSGRGKPWVRTVDSRATTGEDGSNSGKIAKPWWGRGDSAIMRITPSLLLKGMNIQNHVSEYIINH